MKRLRNFIVSTLLGTSMPKRIFESAAEVDEYPTPVYTVDDVDRITFPDEEDERHLQANTRQYDIDPKVGIKNSSLPLSSGRYQLWYNLWPKIDTYKVNDAVWDLSTDRPTFDKYHMFVLPIWWDDEDQSKPFNETTLRATLNASAQYYKEMSWNKNVFTYEIWPQQTVLTGVSKVGPSLTVSNNVTRTIVKNLGKVEFTDYSGISMFHNRATNGSLSTGGGWGNVNGK
jgi:hypothetical protein